MAAPTSSSELQAFLIEQLRDGMSEGGWSQAALSRHVGLSPKHLNQMLNGRAAGSLELWTLLLVTVERPFWRYLR